MHCPVPPVIVTGTAGAGDAFNSTFAAYICASRSTEEALLAAIVNAASVTTHLDTQTGLLALAELETRVAAVRDELTLVQWNV